MREELSGLRHGFRDRALGNAVKPAHCSAATIRLAGPSARCDPRGVAVCRDMQHRDTQATAGAFGRLRWDLGPMAYGLSVAY
jgi:hypothetical protein